ncbi:AGAP006157-PA-like protein [Anopheles sinensis]|uniref:AGAP006157-PA-like protein n=1 Tax=Anopheles sinensis TaxID=74873 RepID=A0A084VBE5_ANOSI|nr:AGAP006157-PA-like protein [Anopheles sinensis]
MRAMVAPWTRAFPALSEPDGGQTKLRRRGLSSEVERFSAAPTTQQAKPTGSFEAVAARPRDYAREVVTGSSLSSPKLVASQNARPLRFWLHLMGIAPSVTVDQVIASVQRRLGTDDVIAFSLLAKDVNPATRNALSFKVRIPMSCSEKALSAETWPTGIRVREFVILPRHENRNRQPSPSQLDLPLSPLSSAGRQDTEFHQHTAPQNVNKTLIHSGTPTTSTPGTTSFTASEHTTLPAVDPPRKRKRGPAPDISPNQPKLDSFFRTQ